MHNPPTIQNVSPSYVAKILAPQPYGTYIVRYQTVNDEIISSIRMNNRPITPPGHRYVYLSVRVDESFYKCPIMNYRLSLVESNGQQNHEKLLQQYNSQRNKQEKFTRLKRELIVPGEYPTWSLDSKQFHGMDFTRSKFGGNHNDGVSEAIWQRPKQDDIKVFIKRFSKPSSHFDNELILLQQLCFFPIMTLYGHYSDDKNKYLIFRHGGISLESICPIGGGKMQSKMFRIVEIAFQIANAMMYLEKKNIVHRDLTASNVLLDSYGYIRIADFGHAIEKEEGKNNLSKSVTNNGEYKFQIRFLAPECLPKPLESRTNQLTDHEQRKLYASFSSKSDVWAFGILLIQLMLKNPSKPYPHIKDDREISRRITINREIHPQPDECNIDVYYILQQCWAYEPIDRLSFAEIREKMGILGTILR